MLELGRPVEENKDYIFWEDSWNPTRHPHRHEQGEQYENKTERIIIR